MKKTRILFIITKLELGGAQKQLLDIISCLDQEKFEPFLFTARDGILLPQALSLKKLTVRRSFSLERNINPLKDLFALAEAYLFIKKNNIQIVHTHSSKAGIIGRIAARLAGARAIIHTVHGWPFNNYQAKLFRRLFIELEKFCARITDRIIVVSDHDKEKGLENNIAPAGGYSVIRYGINYAEFETRERKVRLELGVKDQELLVTNISCFKPQKSPLDFIKVAYFINQSVPGVKFLLVGEGILRGRIEGLIKELNLQEKVFLTGWRNDIPEILSSSDILMLTSLWEGLPVSVLEAMAASKPVIATQTGGIKEAVREGKTGFLVSPGDIRAMSEGLERLLRDGSLRASLSENARPSLGEDFSLAKMARSTQDLYENLMSG